MRVGGSFGGGRGQVPPLIKSCLPLEIASLQSFNTKSLRMHQKQSETV